MQIISEIEVIDGVHERPPALSLTLKVCDQSQDCNLVRPVISRGEISLPALLQHGLVLAEWRLGQA
jgi:hypothetical protein